MKLKEPIGIDIAYNNAKDWWNPATGKDEQIPPDWSVPITPMPDFVICKASERLFNDYTFDSNWRQLGEKGILRGAYHFFRHLSPTADQAKFFVSTIKNAGGVKPGDKLFLDLEEEGFLSATATMDFIWNVQQALGIRPIIYSRCLLLNALSFSKLTSAQKTYMKEVPLWIAGTFDDANEVDEYTSIPKMFIPDQTRWGKVVLWQYGLDVNPVGMMSGLPGGLDFDWIDPEFYAQWKQDTGGVVVTPPTPPTEVPVATYTGTVKAETTPSLNVRSTAGGTIIGKIYPGNAFTADQIQPVSGYKWLHLVTPIVGWVRSDFVTYQEVTVTPPPVVTPPGTVLTAPDRFELTANGVSTWYKKE